MIIVQHRGWKGSEYWCNASALSDATNPKIMKIKQVEKPELKAQTPVVLTTAGNILQMQWQEHRNSKASIQRLDSDHYVILSDKKGKVHEFLKTDNRAQNKNSLRKTFQKIRDIVNANTTEPEKCRWVTLTYAENMTDEKRLRGHLNTFTKSMQREYGKYEYISVREPQGRGAWHMHLILIFPNKAPYLMPERILDAWQHHGFVKAKSMSNCDNVGAYLTAYLADIPLEEAMEKDLLSDDSEIVIKDYKDGTGSKKIVKGGRLALYPTGMNLYSVSSGIKRPLKESMSYEDVQKRLKASSAKLTFESSVELSITDDLTNRIYNAYYTTVSGKNKEDGALDGRNR